MFSVISSRVSSSREKSGVREESNSDPGDDNRLSSPHHKSNGLRADNEYKNGSRSSDNESPVLPNSLKSETDEVSSRSDDMTGNNEEGNKVSNTGSKSISTIFSGHGKLKRLLGTLVQFAMDISLDTGDTVRSLVLGLMVRIIFIIFYLKKCYIMCSNFLILINGKYFYFLQGYPTMMSIVDWSFGI